MWDIKPRRVLLAAENTQCEAAMRFGIEPNSVLASIAGVLLRVLAGPAILMRNAWRGLKIQARPKIWFGISAAIAAVWSLLSGAVLLDLILNLPR